MYTQYLEIRPTKNGNGVFTKIVIPAGKPITEISGDIYTGNQAKPTDLQIGSNTYIGSSGNATDL